MTRNEFNLLYTIKKQGIQSYRQLSALAAVSTGFISQTMKTFRKKRFIDDNGITDIGMKALSPYKVDTAVIMAAGMSTRFVPLSLEKPKGLLEVKGEILIERQIEQLQKAGINKIILVLGYKKEAFFYLESKYDGLTIVINPEYNTKNNVHTLYLAQSYIRNTYICSSDDYFVDDPFEEYVFQSYYAAQHVKEKTNEWYMIPDRKGNIARVDKGGTEGDIMLGHVYWDQEFSAQMLSYINESHETGEYDQDLWEQILLEKVKKLPPMHINVYPDDYIFEFDSLDELRAFDKQYVNNTESIIMRNISKVLECSESEIQNFRPIKEGLTNASFVFEVSGKEFVYRHPGEGTEKIISRTHEKKALELAKMVDVDPTYIFMDAEEGWKISKFIKGIRTPDYNSRSDSLRVVSVMRGLHDKNLSVDWDFRPWEEACKIEKILKQEKGGIHDQEFETLKDDVKWCYDKCKHDGISMRFCHCDTYAPNWMLTDDGSAILIDWEYAGNADPGCDVGTYIMDSMWDVTNADVFIRDYCGNEYNDTLRFHYLAYTALLSYYWYVWALYREACGAIMGDSLYNWHIMAKRYSSFLVAEYKGND